MGRGPKCFYWRKGVSQCADGTCSCSDQELFTVGPIANDVASLSLFSSLFPHPSEEDWTPQESPVTVALTPEISGFHTDDRIVAALRDAGNTLKARGVNVVEAPEGPGSAALRAAAKAYGILATGIIKNHRKMPDSDDYSEAHKLRKIARDAMDGLLQKTGADAWMVPVTSCLPFVHNPRHAKVPVVIDGEETEVPYFRALLSYIQLASVTGSPVVTLPVGSTDQLPIGAQLIGRRGADSALLHAAEIVEKAMASDRGGER